MSRNIEYTVEYAWFIDEDEDDSTWYVVEHTKHGTHAIYDYATEAEARRMADQLNDEP